MHGHKIGLFRTTASAWSADGILAEALPLCSNLESFEIRVSQGSEPIDFPIFHPTIQKVCIIPSVEADVHVPQQSQHIFEHAAMLLGLHTVPYYGYGRTIYGRTFTKFPVTRTVKSFLKHRTVRYG